MALKFTKTAAKTPAAKIADDDTGTAKSTKTEAKVANTSGNSVPKSSGMSFMKKGAEAKQAMVEAEAKAEQAKAEQGKLWRFWMPEGEDRQVTFLDGELDDEGLLNIPLWHEHTIKIKGDFHQFVCTAEADQSQPCPICETGDKAALVGVMTIIDHTPHTVKSGQNAGKVIVNTRKLFVAKRETIKLLTKIASKRGGLTGCTFDIGRSGDKSPNVGNQFDFVHKFGKRSEIMAKYDLKEEDVMPADYEHEITYRSPEQLIELGVSNYKPQANKAGGGGSTTKGSSFKDDL